MAGLKSQEVRTSGASRNVMMGINLSAKIQLDTLNFDHTLFGLGPLDSLQGEITILEGKPYVSSILNGELFTFVNTNLKAPFFVYTYCNEWQEVKLNFKGDFKGLEQLMSNYSSSDVPFPFRIRGVFNVVDYHIIMKDWSSPIHNHDIHYQSKVTFTETVVTGELLGFYSRHHEGIFTHKGDFIHVHLVKQDPLLSAHVDQIKFDGEISLFIPKW